MTTNHTRYIPGKLHKWAVTGTFHGAIIHAFTEGQARAAFHRFYNGESILRAKIVRSNWPLVP